MNIINIYDNFNSYFNTPSKIQFKAIFELCSKIALKSGHKLYLIGGLVRDMLLNQESLDIDITVEGDAIEFAHILEKECNAKILSVHESFGTIKIELQGQKIDFASTRSETYPHKGHLPKVSEIGCSLEKDVLRRDFTINSLALSLNQNDFANLIDYVNGFEDLKNKKIRILHEKSFIDDPTRIIRALKYSARLDFELEETTLKLQKEYLNNVNYDMCNKRIKQEIKKTFSDCKQKAFDEFIDMGIYKLITPHPSPLTQGAREKVDASIKSYKPKHFWLVYLGIIAVFENEDILDKLELTNSEKDVILGAKSLLNVSLKDDFDIYKAFSAQKIETLLILAILGQDKEVFHYLKDLEKIRLHINGNDVLKLGFSPSKHFSEGFEYVLKKKLQNPEMTKVEELEIIKAYLKNA